MHGEDGKKNGDVERNQTQKKKRKTKYVTIEVTIILSSHFAASD